MNHISRGDIDDATRTLVRTCDRFEEDYNVTRTELLNGKRSK